MAEAPNALMAISHELRHVEALSIRPLDPDDAEIYGLISEVREALDELARALERRSQ
jgi:hypothetical protein